MENSQQGRKDDPRPTKLSSEERDGCISIIERFFNDFNLESIWLTKQVADNAWLSSDKPPFNSDERMRLLYYRGREEEFIRAVSSLWKNKLISDKTFSGTVADGQPEYVDLEDIFKRSVDMQLQVAHLVRIISSARIRKMNGRGFSVQ